MWFNGQLDATMVLTTVENQATIDWTFNAPTDHFVFLVVTVYL